MRVEFRRSNAPCGAEPVGANGDLVKASRDFARLKLEQFYEFTRTCFFPKKKYEHVAPHEVLLIDDDGTLVVRYSLADLVRERRVYLTTRRD